MHFAEQNIDVCAQFCGTEFKQAFNRIACIIETKAFGGKTLILEKTAGRKREKLFSKVWLTFSAFSSAAVISAASGFGGVGVTDISLLKKTEKMAEKLGDQRKTDIMPMTGSDAGDACLR
jgi:hypothetical protein